MTPLDLPQELQEGSVLVVTHEPSCLVIRVKKVHGLFKGVGYLIETKEGNLALVRGWTGFTADIAFLPKGTNIEDAIAIFGPAQD
jgi:hypothetical protein